MGWCAGGDTEGEQLLGVIPYPLFEGFSRLSPYCFFFFHCSPWCSKLAPEVIFFFCCFLKEEIEHSKRRAVKGRQRWCSSGMLQLQEASLGGCCPRGLSSLILDLAVLAGALLCNVGHNPSPGIPGGFCPALAGTRGLCSVLDLSCSLPVAR